MKKTQPVEMDDTPRSSAIPMDSPLLPLVFSTIGIALMGLVEQIPKPDASTVAFVGIAYVAPLMMVFGPRLIEKSKMVMGR